MFLRRSHNEQSHFAHALQNLTWNLAFAVHFPDLFQRNVLLAPFADGVSEKLLFLSEAKFYHEIFTLNPTTQK
jgi:hypothetical protein